MTRDAFPFYSLNRCGMQFNPYWEIIAYSVRNTIKISECDMSIDDFLSMGEKQKKDYIPKSLSDFLKDDVSVVCKSNRKSSVVFSFKAFRDDDILAECLFERCVPSEYDDFETETAVKLSFANNVRLKNFGIVNGDYGFNFIGNTDVRGTMAILMAITRTIIDADAILKYYKLLKMRCSNILSSAKVFLPHPELISKSSIFPCDSYSIIMCSYDGVDTVFTKRIDLQSGVKDMSTMASEIEKMSGTIIKDAANDFNNKTK